MLLYYNPLSVLKVKGAGGLLTVSSHLFFYPAGRGIFIAAWKAETCLFVLPDGPKEDRSRPSLESPATQEPDRFLRISPFLTRLFGFGFCRLLDIVSPAGIASFRFSPAGGGTVLSHTTSAM